jgi:hypothetical protein
MNKNRTVFTMPTNHIVTIDPNWLLGFIEREGTFSHVSNFYPHLSITQNKRDYFILEAIQSHLNVGQCKLRKEGSASNKEMSDYLLNKVELLSNVVVPLLQPLTWHTLRVTHFAKWAKIVEIHLTGRHRYDDTKDLIKQVFKLMNIYRLSTYNGRYGPKRYPSFNSHAVLDELLSRPPVYNKDNPNLLSEAKTGNLNPDFRGKKEE